MNIPRGAVVGLAAGIMAGLFLLTPPVRWLRLHNPERTQLMELRLAQAKKLHRAYRVDQRWVSLDAISPTLQATVLAAEDDTFYRHQGVDYDVTWQALKTDWKRKKYAQGGSTITQQVAKNLFLNPRKTIGRKLKEVLIAWRLEHALTKQRILEIYLNTAEWGHGVFGAEAAAQKYFNKPAADLSLAEAVSLVAVLPSPLRHAPTRVDAFVTWRSAWISHQMKILGYLRRLGVDMEPAVAAAAPAKSARPAVFAPVNQAGAEAAPPDDARDLEDLALPADEPDLDSAETAPPAADPAAVGGPKAPLQAKVPSPRRAAKE